MQFAPLQKVKKSSLLDYDTVAFLFCLPCLAYLLVVIWIDLKRR